MTGVFGGVIKSRNKLAARVLAAAAFVCAHGTSTSSQDIGTVGDVLQIATPVTAIYWSYRVNGVPGLEACGRSVLINLAFTQALRRGINERRPNGGGGGMPSGHTSGAASGFGCMLGQEGWSTRTWVLAGAAALTGYSRVATDSHDWSQVIAGFLFGGTVGYLGTRHLREGAQIEYDVSRDGTHRIGLRLEF